MRFQVPCCIRTDSSPVQGIFVRISAVVELSVSGMKSSPSQACSMCMVGEYRCSTLVGCTYNPPRWRKTSRKIWVVLAIGFSAWKEWRLRSSGK